MEAVIYNFNIMRSLSKQYLVKANAGSKPDCTTSILYSAFALEAYLNFAGDRIFNCWDQIEKGLNPVAKIQLISEHLNLELDLGSRPIQTVKQVFDVRNRVVHPKAELAEGDYASVNSLPMSVWEKSSTNQLAERAIEDFGQIMYVKFGGLEIDKLRN